MGIIEKIMVTPSHHRVHHAKNKKYIDKNYGGTLIIWDKLFGTFEEEIEIPIYGITTPLRSWNPLWENSHHWFRMFSLAKELNGFGKFQVLFRGPGSFFFFFFFFFPFFKFFIFFIFFYFYL